MGGLHWENAHFGGDFGGPHWTNSHFGGASDDYSIVDASFGCDFGLDDPHAGVGSLGTDGLGLDTSFGADVEFGLEPASTAILSMGAFGAVAATVHHLLAAHHILTQQRLLKENHRVQQAQAERSAMGEYAGNRALAALGGTSVSGVGSSLIDRKSVV
jgi:hypothetical protein